MLCPVRKRGGTNYYWQFGNLGFKKTFLTLNSPFESTDFRAVQNNKETYSMTAHAVFCCVRFSISSGRSSRWRAQMLRGPQEWNWRWPELPSRLQVRTRWDPQHRTQNTSAPYLWESDVSRDSKALRITVLSYRFECTPNTKLWNMKHEWLCISKSQFIPSVCTFEAFSLALAANADMRSPHVHNRHLVVSSTSCPLLWTHAYRAINSLCGLTCLISACLMNSTVTFMYIRQIKHYGHS